MKKQYLLLAVALAGIVLPMSQFIPASLAGEFSIGGMIREMTATRMLRGVTYDFLVAVVAGLLFGFFEVRRLGIGHWWIPLVGTFVIGFSFGLPFFLFLRERAMMRAAGGRDPG